VINTRQATQAKINSFLLFWVFWLDFEWGKRSCICWSIYGW